VTPGVDAFGHVPGDVEGLAARITELAAGPELRAQLGRAADRRAVIRSSTSRPRSRADLSRSAPGVRTDRLVVNCPQIDD
jgi:hypothetical protein